MKKYLLSSIVFILLFMVAALGGIFYPRFVPGLAVSTGEAADFDVKKTDHAGIINHVSGMKLETFSAEILKMISIHEAAINADELLYLNALIERFIKENPDAAIASFKGNAFIRANTNAKRRYVMGLFSALAKFYPERFPAYFIELANNPDYLSPKGFLPYRDTALAAFFSTLVAKSPELAMRMLEDGSMDQVKGIQPVGSDISFFGLSIKQPPVPYEDILNNLRQTVVLKQAQDNPVLFQTELDKTKGESERNILMYGMAARFLGEDPGKALEWIKKNMKEKDRDRMMKMLFSMESWNDKGWQNALVYANEIGFDKMNSWELRGLFAKAGKNNPEAAINTIERNLKGEIREEMLSAVLSGLIESKSAAEMLAVVNGLEKGICRDMTVPVFFGKYYKESPDEALLWGMTQENTYFISDTVRMMFRENKEAGKDLAIKVIASDSASDSLVTQIAGAFGNSREDGLDLISKLEGEKRSKFVKQFYSHWMAEDVGKAIDSLSGETFSEKEKADVKKQIILESASTYPPTQMVKVIEKIDDPGITEYMATRFVWTFDDGSTDTEGRMIIDQTLKRNDVSESLKQAIANALESKRNGAEKPVDIGTRRYYHGR